MGRGGRGVAALLLFSAVLGLVGSGVAVPARAEASATDAAAEADIRARIEGIPGMRVVGEKPAAPGIRYFELTYRQPNDHRHPERGSFEQRLSLQHRSTQRPMVLYTSGYDLGAGPNFRSEPATLLDGNQIYTEQRYFGTSSPDPADLANLNIQQAAADHHRLIEALKSIYRGSWISTGGSKGGMTTVYHRRFYPNDVDGSVVYSAPNNTDDRDDTAYDEFLARVGTPECRAALQAVQREALVRRDEMGARYAQWAKEKGQTFETLGSVDKAFELAVLRLPTMFWMYAGEQKCADVPTPAASSDELYAWVDGITRLAVYTDSSVEFFRPYFYQLGTQLGYIQVATPHLDGLLRYPGIQEVRSYVPRDIALRFEPEAMRDIDRWVRLRGSEILFVYGENDPVRAEPFRLGPGSRDARVLVAPHAGHSVSIGALAPGDAARASAALRRWAGV
ncbi:S28 family serine protease [Embleya sp. NBC_00896]|uniref:S28 family serine protease n=1 Tax=Embleya sp. NBC_00896 TaxID=2975961 RepID=UPI003869DDF3|nr:aminopeptidase [Embleya sp. NBC_00896]